MCEIFEPSMVTVTFRCTPPRPSINVPARMVIGV